MYVLCGIIALLLSGNQTLLLCLYLLYATFYNLLLQHIDILLLLHIEILLLLHIDILLLAY